MTLLALFLACSPQFPDIDDRAYLITIQSLSPMIGAIEAGRANHPGSGTVEFSGADDYFNLARATNSESATQVTATTVRPASLGTDTGEVQVTAIWEGAWTLPSSYGIEGPIRGEATFSGFAQYELWDEWPYDGESRLAWQWTGQAQVTAFDGEVWNIDFAAACGPRQSGSGWRGHLERTLTPEGEAEPRALDNGFLECGEGPFEYSINGPISARGNP